MEWWERVRGCVCVCLCVWCVWCVVWGCGGEVGGVVCGVVFW